MPTLAEIRTQFPEYDDMPDDKLAGALHQKFYPDMPRADFDQRIGFKAPDPTGGRTPPATGLGKTVDGATAALTQGATFGFADEVGAAGSWVGQKLRNLTHGDPTPAGQVYDESLAANRKQLADFDKSNPALSIGLQMLGGFTGALPAAVPVSQVAPTVLTRTAGMLGNARAAAVPAAIAGFGSGEGGVENRGINAVQSGIIGGAAGAALPSIANAGVSLVGKIGHILGVRNADKAATNHLLRAFERDGITMEDAGARLGQWEAAGAKPEALFDLGGENVRGLARAAAGVPSEARQRSVQMLAARQEGQSGRIADDVAAAISPERDYYATFEGLVKKRRDAAGPLYDAAYAKEGVWSDDLAGMMRRPALAQAWQKAQGIAANEGHDLPRVFKMDDAGNIVGIEKIPDMRAIDYIKRGLDDVIQDAKDPITGKIKTDAGRAVDTLRREFLFKLDKLNPDYAKARASFAGDTDSMNAMALGRGVFKEESEITAKEVAAMSPSDKDFFRAGVFRAIKEISNKTTDGADVSKRIFGSPALREKIQSAFDNPADFAKFAAQIRREADMYRDSQFVSPRTGSQTEMRRADAADMAADPAGNIVEGLAQGHSLKQVAVNAARNLYRRGEGINSATGDALATRLFTPGQAQTAATLQQLQTARAQRLQDMTNARQRLRGLLDVGGTDIGVLSN